MSSVPPSPIVSMSLSVQTILIWYGNRWLMKVDHWRVIQPLCLGNFRLQAYEAVERWYAIVHVVLTFLQWRFYGLGHRGNPCTPSPT